MDRLGIDFVVCFSFHQRHEQSLFVIESQIIESVQDVISDLWYLIDEAIGDFLNVLTEIVVSFLALFGHYSNEGFEGNFDA